MRFCHACQQELDAASLAAARCANCGAAVRPLAKRTVDDKRALRGPKVSTPGGGTTPGDQHSDPSIDITEVGQDRGRATIELSPSGTTRMLSGKDPATPPAAPEETLQQPGKASGPQRKSPTVSERVDMTVEYAPPPEGDRPARRSTHTFESDRTLDLSSLPPEEVQELESQWRGTFDPGSKQGQTIRQKETITGYR
jgi:hypothetical protein